MPKVAIVFQSNNGHTAVLAEAVRRGALSVAGTEATLIPVSKADDHAQQLDAADAIVFGAPTFMGNVPAEFKQFMDSTASVWIRQGWRNKVAAGFTCSACWSGDKLNTLMQMAVFAAQHSMLWAPLGMMPGNYTSTGSPSDLNRVGGFLGAMAQANADEGTDVAPPQADRDTAQHLGKQVAEIVHRFTYGSR
ncbi:MAG TPA: flavodoxin family protein [Paraburkholderia sp.]|jgi:multimeric flavodoxin WrbA|nr:flavodoxin family protein [Paraburkholderia sp.]